MSEVEAPGPIKEAAAPAGDGLSAGRLKRRGPLSSWWLVLLLILWLGTFGYNLSQLRERTLSSWSARRLADRQLRLAGSGMAGRPAPLFAEEPGSDLHTVIVYWAARFQGHASSRSQAAAAVLWHLAGEDQRVVRAALEEPRDPDQTLLVQTLLNGGPADQAALDRWRDAVTAHGENYWWEEQLWLELAARSQGEAPSLVAEVSAARGRHQRDLASWGRNSGVLLSVGGVLFLGIFLWRSRGKLRWHPVPPALRRIGWRRLLAGTAAAEVLVFAAVLGSGWLLQAFQGWTHGSYALYQTAMRVLAPLFLLLLFFRKPRIGLRALRLDRGFKLMPVLAVVGLVVLVDNLCGWLLPHGGECNYGFALNEWTFGFKGLGLGLWLGCVVAPLSEEIVYRGFFFNAVQARWGMLPALVVVNAVFSAIHGYAWDQSVSVFVGGVLLSLLYRLSGSLAAAVAGHALLNFYAVASTWYSFESPYW